MSQQLSLFDAKTPRNSAIQQGLDSVESYCPDFRFMAYRFLLKYTKTPKEFMIEDVRVASKGIVPDVHDNRVWGAIAAIAAKTGLITRSHYQPTKNPNAHNAIGTYWKVV